MSSALEIFFLRLTAFSSRRRKNLSGDSTGGENHSAFVTPPGDLNE
jgi:hypothetical protein